MFFARSASFLLTGRTSLSASTVCEVSAIACTL